MLPVIVLCVVLRRGALALDQDSYAVSLICPLLAAPWVSQLAEHVSDRVRLLDRGSLDLLAIRVQLRDLDQGRVIRQAEPPSPCSTLLHNMVLLLVIVLLPIIVLDCRLFGHSRHRRLFCHSLSHRCRLLHGLHRLRGCLRSWLLHPAASFMAAT